MEIDQELRFSKIIREGNEVVAIKEHKENSIENKDVRNGNGGNNGEEGEFGPSSKKPLSLTYLTIVLQRIFLK